MRVLIVDDEPVSRNLLEKVMRDIAECEAADSGAAAIVAYKKALEKWAPFDLMTLDISMPEMDGKEVLNQIREIEKDKDIPKDRQIKIFMVSGHSDKQTIVRCVEIGCDDFISKPFNKRIIAGKLLKLGFDISGKERLKGEVEKKEDREEALDQKGLMRNTISDIVEQFNRGEIDMPVLPMVVQDVKKVMDEPFATVYDLAEVIVRDAVISIRLIAIANSPLYRGSQEIRTVEKAIPRLGFNETQSIVSAIANKGLYDAKNSQVKDIMEQLWFHSLASAYCSKAIAKKLALGDAEKFFFMGLIHDIGKPLILKRLDEISSPKKPLNITNDMQIIDQVHTTFGESLISRWGFTKDYARIPLLHEDSNYSENTEKEILVVNLANYLSRKIGYSLHDDDFELTDIESGKLLGIDPSQLDLIGEEVKTMMQKTSDTY
jgi:HD-like signal output (HDOD) protein/DNA-binding NarL/FixJ family response regulator